MTEYTVKSGYDDFPPTLDAWEYNNQLIGAPHWVCAVMQPSRTGDSIDGIEIRAGTVIYLTPEGKIGNENTDVFLTHYERVIS